MFVGVHYLRGLAALMVVYFHLFGYQISTPLSMFAGGEFGVDMFFVISGFVMWITTERGNVTPQEFVTRRIVRVVPLYWLFTLLLVAITVLLPGLAPRTAVSFELVAKSLAFVPHSSPAAPQDLHHPVLSQGWTLDYEVFFYLIFSASLLLDRARHRYAATAFVLILLPAAGRFLSTRSPLVEIYTNPILIEFLLGMTIGYGRHTLTAMGTCTGLALVTAGAAMTACCGFVQPVATIRLIDFGIGSALLVAGSVVLEAPLARSASRLLTAVGDASYALYLSHGFTIKVIMAIFAKTGAVALAAIGSMAYAALAVVTALLGSILAACAVHYLVEKPLTRALQELLATRVPSWCGPWPHAPAKAAAMSAPARP